jgi:nucleotide-binding universal stress UspA family protein
MFKKLLVPLDGSSLAEEAIGCAAAIARASGASVDLVLVHQPFPFVAFNETPWNAASVQHESVYLASVADELRTGAGVTVTQAVVQGETAPGIVAHAAETGADLIVMTSHGRTGLSRAWIGSIAGETIRRSTVPVLVLRPVKTATDRRAAHQPFKSVLVTLDGSELALEIVAAAASLARCNSAKLILLRIVQPVPLVSMDVGMPYVSPAPIPDDAATERIVDEAKQDLADVARGIGVHGLDVETHVVVDAHVAGGIIDFARAHGGGAIAMSTQGRGAARVVFGSVADKVLRASGLPVMLRHPVNVRVEEVLDLHMVGAHTVR